MISHRFVNDGIPRKKLNRLQQGAKDRIEKKIASKHYTFEEVNCPICLESNYELLVNKDRYGLYYPVNICTSCGLMITSPRMTEASYTEFYNEEYRDLYTGFEEPPQAYFTHQHRQGKKIYDYIASTGLFSEKKIVNVLEVGCGAGGILQYFKSQGHKVSGIDLGDDFLKFGRDQYGLDLEFGSIHDIHFKSKPDLIIYAHVIEHIPDIEKEIRKLRELCHEKTVIYIEIPSIKWVHDTYECDFLYYFQNAHTYHFSMATLERYMAFCGLKLLHGNEHARTLFVFDNDANKKHFTNQYDDIMKYIIQLERTRYKYYISPNFFKKTIRQLGIKLIGGLGIKNIVKRILKIDPQRT